MQTGIREHTHVFDMDRRQSLVFVFNPVIPYGAVHRKGFLHSMRKSPWFRQPIQKETSKIIENTIQYNLIKIKGNMTYRLLERTRWWKKTNTGRWEIYLCIVNKIRKDLGRHFVFPYPNFYGFWSPLPLQPTPQYLCAHAVPKEASQSNAQGVCDIVVSVGKVQGEGEKADWSKP